MASLLDIREKIRFSLFNILRAVNCNIDGSYVPKLGCPPKIGASIGRIERDLVVMGCVLDVGLLASIKRGPQERYLKSLPSPPLPLRSEYSASCALVRRNIALNAYRHIITGKFRKFSPHTNIDGSFFSVERSYRMGTTLHWTHETSR